MRSWRRTSCGEEMSHVRSSYEKRTWYDGRSTSVQRKGEKERKQIFADLLAWTDPPPGTFEWIVKKSDNKTIYYKFVAHFMNARWGARYYAAIRDSGYHESAGEQVEKIFALLNTLKEHTMEQDWGEMMLKMNNSDLAVNDPKEQHYLIDYLQKARPPLLVSA